jgi:hypothetical protein
MDASDDRPEAKAPSPIVPRISVYRTHSLVDWGLCQDSYTSEAVAKFLAPVFSWTMDAKLRKREALESIGPYGESRTFFALVSCT